MHLRAVRLHGRDGGIEGAFQLLDILLAGHHVGDESRTSDDESNGDDSPEEGGECEVDGGYNGRGVSGADAVCAIGEEDNAAYDRPDDGEETVEDESNGTRLLAETREDDDEEPVAETHDAGREKPVLDAETLDDGLGVARALEGVHASDDGGSNASEHEENGKHCQDRPRLSSHGWKGKCCLQD